MAHEILTEAGDVLLTESGEALLTEQWTAHGSGSVTNLGRLKVANECPYAYKNVVAAETVTLRGGDNKPAGVLAGVTVNAVGTGTLIVYDNTAGSGNIIASITVTSLGTYWFDVQANVGITYVRSASDGNITIAYR